MKSIKLSLKINGVDFTKVFEYDFSFIEFVNKVAVETNIEGLELPLLDTIDNCKRFIRKSGLYEIVDYEKEFNMYDTTSRALNAGVDIKEVLELHARDHRTLQQKFTGFCLAWIEKVGSADYGFDGRNEYSHRQCTKIKEIMEKEHITSWMPLI